MGSRILWALGVALLAAAPAWAQAPDLPAERRAAFEAADEVKMVGPAEVPLRDQATLRMPHGYLYVPQPQAGRLLQAMGGRGDERLQGLVFPAADEPWLVLLQFEPGAGYSLRLVSDVDKLDRYRPAAWQLLGALDYPGGKRYAEFKAAPDKEPGFFAKLGALIAKFAKAI